MTYCVAASPEEATPANREYQVPTSDMAEVSSLSLRACSITYSYFEYDYEGIRLAIA